MVKRHTVAKDVNRGGSNMYSQNVFRLCGTAAAALVALTTSVASQTEQKSAKELIAGSWTLMIADNLSREGNNVPGFGPLPTGTARFGTDGRYSFEVVPSTGKQSGVSASGTYTLDEAGKALTLKVEESSVPNWKGTTQTGAVKFISSDHLGFTTSAPLVASSDFSGTELIWARTK
jgi:lipocalin-like protein